MYYYAKVVFGYIRVIASETGSDQAQACLGHIKKELFSKVAIVPDRDKWRLDFLTKLLKQRGEALYIVDTKEVQRLSGLIDSICVNWNFDFFLMMGGGAPPHFDTSIYIIISFSNSYFLTLCFVEAYVS